MKSLIFFNIFSVIVHVHSHIGEKCNFGAVCWPLNARVYCDKQHICRCRPEFPIQVGDHECEKGRYYGELCRFDKECTFLDNNTRCYLQKCECIDDYVLLESKCVESKSILFLPTNFT